MPAKQHSETVVSKQASTGKKSTAQDSERDGSKMVVDDGEQEVGDAVKIAAAGQEAGVEE